MERNGALTLLATLGLLGATGYAVWYATREPDVALVLVDIHPPGPSPVPPDRPPCGCPPTNGQGSGVPPTASLPRITGLRLVGYEGMGGAEPEGGFRRQGATVAWDPAPASANGQPLSGYQVSVRRASGPATHLAIHSGPLPPTPVAMVPVDTIPAGTTRAFVPRPDGWPGGTIALAGIYAGRSGPVAALTLPQLAVMPM